MLIDIPDTFEKLKTNEVDPREQFDEINAVLHKGLPLIIGKDYLVKGPPPKSTEGQKGTGCLGPLHLALAIEGTPLALVVQEFFPRQPITTRCSAPTPKNRIWHPSIPFDLTGRCLEFYQREKLSGPWVNEDWFPQIRSALQVMIWEKMPSQIKNDYSQIVGYDLEEDEPSVMCDYMHYIDLRIRGERDKTVDFFHRQENDGEESVMLRQEFFSELLTSQQLRAIRW